MAIADEPTPTAVADTGSASASPEAATLESEIREVLRNVVDPELGLDVISLGLIRDLAVTEAAVEIEMIFTTPFCPYGGILLQQVKDMARTVTEREIRVTLLEEMWSPDMMEGGDWSEWGLI